MKCVIVKFIVNIIMKYIISGSVMCSMLVGSVSSLLFLRLNIVMMVNSSVISVIGLMCGRKCLVY